MEKRGVNLTFKWIFALIAGFIIFLFIINFGYNHIYLSESKTSAILVNQFENQLESLSISEFLTKEIDMGNVFEINFDCNSISNKNVELNTEKIIFSDRTIKAKDFLLWTQLWKYPFGITNFYYLIDKNQKFYFFDAPYELTSSIPPTFPIYSFPDKVPEDSTIVFFKQPSPIQLQEYQDHNIKIVKNNKITFYPNKQTDYYGDEMLLGAIFTDNYNKYECLKNKAIKKLNIISYVYQKKAETLSRIGCSDKYLMIMNLLNDFNLQNPEAIQNADEEIERNGSTPLFQ